ncbi:MAG: TPM domain-containing protein [Bdellovibrionota bacterium]
MWRSLASRVVLLGLFLPRFALATEASVPATPSARVNDYAQVLSVQAKTGLEAKFEHFEKTTGHQAVVAIFPNIGDAPIEDFAAKLFEKWKLGSKDKNDGILLVLGLQERALRIEVGYGLEGQLPDALAGQIIRHDMVPFLKQNQVATAILAFHGRLEEIFVAGTPPKYGSQSKRRPIGFGSGIGLLIIILVFIIFLFPHGGGRYDRTIGPGGIYRRRRGIGGLFPPIGGGGGWGGSGGFGGWGGGGGGLSGGGGASGRW